MNFIQNTVKCQSIAQSETSTLIAMMDMITENVIKSQRSEKKRKEKKKKTAESQFQIFPHFTFIFVVPVHLFCLQALKILRIPKNDFCAVS
jgi:hypothetical protein